MALRLRQEQLRQYCAQLRALLASGTTEQEACKLLGLSWPDYEELKAKLLEQETTKIKELPPETLYAEYKLQQETNIHDLTEMIKDFKDKKQHAAMVGAVKARAEIQDRIIEKGQELGFVTKVPERTEIIAGITVAQLSNDDLRQLIADEISSLGKLVSFGSGSIIDVSPGPLHRPDPTPEEPLEVVAEPPPLAPVLALVSGEPQAVTPGNKVRKGNRGRRVVKEKTES